jgi:hypothetical protein
MGFEPLYCMYSPLRSRLQPLLEVDIALPKFWDLFELNRAITTVFINTNVIWTTKELSDNPFDVEPATFFVFNLPRFACKAWKSELSTNYFWCSNNTTLLLIMLLNTIFLGNCSSPPWICSEFLHPLLEDIFW